MPRTSPAPKSAKKPAPAQPKSHARSPGRPKKDAPPRKVMTIRVDLACVEWMYRYLSRGEWLGDFINEALKEKIAREGTPRRRSES